MVTETSALIYESFKRAWKGLDVRNLRGLTRLSACVRSSATWTQVMKAPSLRPSGQC